MIINPLKKVDFIKATDLLYTQKIGTYEEDELFNSLSMDYKLDNPFSYQMAFLKHNEIYHCFLTPVSKLKKKSFCFPEPLIFQALLDENLIKENNFCILNLYDQNLYLYFYEEGKFSSLKKMENFNQNNMQFFLEQNRFIELLKHYGSKIIIHNKIDNIQHHITLPIQCLNLEDLINKNSFLKLSLYSAKYLDQTCNFIKHNKLKMPFYLKMLLLFILIFALTMIFLLCGDFIQYKQNKEIQNKNNLIQEQLVKLKQDKEKLLTKIRDLNLTLDRKILSTQQQKQILSSLISEINLNKNQAPLLKEIILWLNTNKLKITHLKLEESKITLTFSNENYFQLALKQLNLNFKILNKDEVSYKITLEISHE